MEMVFGTVLGCSGVGYLHFFLIPMTILGIVHSVRSPMLLTQVAIYFVTSFLGDLDGSFSTRSFVPLFALVRRFLMIVCVRHFLGTYTLNSLKRQEK